MEIKDVFHGFNQMKTCLLPGLSKLQFSCALLTVRPYIASIVDGWKDWWVFISVGH